MIRGFYQYQSPGYDIVLQLCKTLPLGKLGKVYKESLYYFFQFHVNLQLSFIFNFRKREKYILTPYSQGKHNSHIIQITIVPLQSTKMFLIQTQFIATPVLNLQRMTTLKNEIQSNLFYSNDNIKNKPMMPHSELPSQIYSTCDVVVIL